MFSLLLTLTGYRMVEIVDRGDARDTQITYITAKAVRMEFPSTETAVILRLDKEGVKAYMLDLKEKTYTDISSMASSFSTVYMAMFVKCDESGKKCRVDRSVIKPTDEYKTINGHRARKVVYYMKNLKELFTSMGQSIPDSVENWFVKDWKDLYRAEMLRTKFLSDFSRRTFSSPEARVILKDLDTFLMGILKKYGAPIVTVSPGMGNLVKVTRVSVKRVKVPEDKFRVPEGFGRK